MTVTTVKRKKNDGKLGSIVGKKSYATGRRKSASARVWIYGGSGKVVVNGKSIEEYFARPTQRMVVNRPFVATNKQEQCDVWCTVCGGGLSGQAGAVMHGVSRAVDDFFATPEIHEVLRKGGLLTRDDRTVERKKYGRKKARKRFQFSKR
jgi:small subunit ribosomal protein S9